ncbi:hypothetical protein IJ21_10610 [Paenibacillus sp. 32O-W]|jgi:septal ring factor EnvC (AmiA/AmiB activator)|nr:hypothetical protein IJ21_10610 [Paenibacillus sp. 32O-W]
MNTRIEHAETLGRYERASRKKSNRSFLVFLIAWLLLIGSGAYGALKYTEHLRAVTVAELERQTAAQITKMQDDYDARIRQLQAKVDDKLVQLEDKINALNELLTFTKDNATNKTDNSNKLYTEINEVKKQLNELQKNLEVLK